MNVGVNGLIVQTLMKFAPGLMMAFVDYPFNKNVLPKACNVSEIDFILASMIVRVSSLSRIAYILSMHSMRAYAQKRFIVLWAQSGTLACIVSDAISRSLENPRLREALQTTLAAV